MSTQVDIPGYVAGTWVIDTARSDVSFQVRQLGIFTVRGGFDDFEGTITTARNPLDSSVSAVIQAASVNTKNSRRDKHLRTDEFLHVEQHPTITFTSRGVRADGATILVDGDLTIRGNTRPVTLTVAANGFGAGPDGAPRARFTASTEIAHRDFDAVHGPTAAVISKNITIMLSIEATRQG